MRLHPSRFAVAELSPSQLQECISTLVEAKNKLKTRKVSSRGH